MPFSVQGNVKHSRTRAILVRTHYFTKKTPFFHFLQISSSSRPVLGQRRWKHFLLRFPILAWLSPETNLMQHIHAAAETFLKSCWCTAIAACFDRNTDQALLHPPRAKAAAPAHPPLAPASVWESCKECPNPRESCYSEIKA